MCVASSFSPYSHLLVPLPKHPPPDPNPLADPLHISHFKCKFKPSLSVYQPNYSPWSDFFQLVHATSYLPAYKLAPLGVRRLLLIHSDAH